MGRGTASWMGEDPLPLVALWVIARLVCVVCWLRGCGRIPYCRENPGESDASLVGLLLAQCRRHLPAPRLVASCRDTVVAPRGVRGRATAVRATRFIWESTREDNRGATVRAAASRH
ncbi:retrotransposon hot spot (RHS) protein [Trypanosoma cruzi]|nr:retrotransposon hot spot (RHS) protein [Trypanosoma cruzi]